MTSVNDRKVIRFSDVREGDRILVTCRTPAGTESVIEGVARRITERYIFDVESTTLAIINRPGQQIVLVDRPAKDEPEYGPVTFRGPQTAMYARTTRGWVRVQGATRMEMVNYTWEELLENFEGFPVEVYGV